MNNMRKHSLLVSFLLISVSLLSQTSTLSKSKTTRAVVIGISDYADDEIPDLQFAHRDASAFAAWLASPAGGNVPKGQVQVLLNEEATTGHIVESLGWLVEESQDGDKAIFYFSGHGDVETITKFKRGFLLAHDAPPRSYMTGGVLPLRYIEDITNTLSEKGVQMVIITDACRSGKLAGSKVGGAQYTSAQLARRFSNEIKILSCQPEEFSSEGIQWGGGHGAFSYHLLDGLYGLADRDADYQITLSEIDRYLEDHVPVEVAPLHQTPISFGRRDTRIALVNEELLTTRKTKKSTTLPMMGSVAQKQLTQQFLEGLDIAVQKRYGAFEEALEAKAFFEPAATCADTYYEQLIADATMAPLHSAMRRKFAAHLQDDAQRALNATLNLDVNIIAKDRVVLAQQYQQFPKYLKRSAQLLGEEHYMYKSLIARSFYFQGFVKWLESGSSANQETANHIMEFYRSSLEEEPYAPHTYYQLGIGYAVMYNQPDSALQYINQAMEQSPTWVLPYASLAYIYMKSFKRFDDAKILLDKCIAIDPDNNYVLRSLASWHYFQNQIDDAEVLFQRILKQDSLDATIWFNLGSIYLKTGKIAEAETAFLSAIKGDTTFHLAYYGLGFLYQAADRLSEAEEMFAQSIRANAKFISGRKKLGVIYYKQKRYEAARNIWLEAYILKPHDIELCENISTVSIDLQDRPKALEFLEKAFSNGATPSYESIVKDYELLNDLEAYQTLLKKYFPNVTKK